MNKKEFLLDSIIKAYLEHLEPIGSGQLKAMYDISFSPATIRGYFKKLGEEGYLAQEHASSGRTPTTEALKEYWQNRLKFVITQNIYLDYNTLVKFAKQTDLTIFLKQEQTQLLNRVLNIEDIYLLLEFNNFSITIKYNSALEKFLNDMKGLEAIGVLEVARQVGARELYEELDKYLFYKDFEIINIKSFLRLCVDYNLQEAYIQKFLSGAIMDRLENGLYFHNSKNLGQMLPHSYLGIAHNVSIQNKQFKMLVLGELSKDYEYFYKGVINE